MGDGVFAVARFAEKPALAVAEAYLAEGGYFWNGGIFLFSPEVMLAEMAAHRRDIHDTALEAVDAAGRDGLFARLDDQRFLAIPLGVRRRGGDGAYPGLAAVAAVRHRLGGRGIVERTLAAGRQGRRAEPHPR